MADLVEDSTTRCAAIVDPVLDYDEKVGRAATTFADAVLDEAAPDPSRAASEHAREATA